MCKTAIYPGSFDPVTNGHLNIIERATEIFDRVIVAILFNPSKTTTLFNIEERLEMLQEAVRGYRGVEVDSFQGLLMDYAEKRRARVVIRGMRAVSDFEYEFQMALMNRKLNDNVQTVFLMPSLRSVFTSSTLIRQVAQFGGRVDELVPPLVCRRLKEKFGHIHP